MNRSDITGESGILFEEGEDTSMLVIAFSGGFNLLMMNPYDFMSVTGLQQYHRVFLQDQDKLWYQNGVNTKLSSFRKLCAFLAEIIDVLGVEKVLVIGTSSGGYAALLAAHRLKADAVHAFGPQTNIGLGFLREKSVRSQQARKDKVRNLYKKRWMNWRNFDLRKALRRHNGITRYFIHYSIDHPRDRVRAEYLSGTPGVQLYSYPYKNHGIVGRLRKKGMLDQLFAAGNVLDPGALYDHYYANPGINGNRPDDVQAEHLGIADIVQAATVTRPSLDHIAACTDLPAQLALDSVACLEIIVKLENSYGVHIDMDMIDMADFKTLDSLASLVDRSKHPH